MSLPGINGINATLLASLLFILELRRTVDSGHLLREVTARSAKVAWVLLVNHDLGCQKLAFLALDRLE
jgi:hypothetical protein